MVLPSLSDENRRFISLLFDDGQMETIKAMTSIEGVGLSFVKMNEKLTKAGSVAFSLQACGLKNSNRTRSVELLCTSSLMKERVNEMRAAIGVVRTLLRLKRSPVRHTGFELSNGCFSEAKVYLQTNIKDEMFDEDGVVYSPTSLQDELDVIEAICGHLKNDAAQPRNMLKAVRETSGLGLDMVGLDLRNDGRIELKLYFAPPEGSYGLAGSDGSQIAGAGINALNRQLGSTPDAKLLPVLNTIMESESTLKLNQISTEMLPSGLMKTKLYFDLWARNLVSDAKFSACKLTFASLKSICEKSRINGFKVPAPGELDQFENMARTNGFELDAFCIENLGFETRLKIYVRPIGNSNGDGLRWSVQK